MAARTSTARCATPEPGRRRPRHRHRRSVGVIVGGAGLFAAAVWPEDAATAKAEYCDSLSAFATTVESYEGLTPHLGAWDEVLDQGEDWVNAYDNDLTDAYWDLYFAVEGLDGDNTAAESYEDLQDELSAFPDAFAATHDGTGCSTT